MKKILYFLCVIIFFILNNYNFCFSQLTLNRELKFLVLDISTNFSYKQKVNIIQTLENELDKSDEKLKKFKWKKAQEIIEKRNFGFIDLKDENYLIGIGDTLGVNFIITGSAKKIDTSVVFTVRVTNIDTHHQKSEDIHYENITINSFIKEKTVVLANKIYKLIIKIQ